jgi:hypothetical protein
MKNNIIVWDILTGKIKYMIRNQTETEITAYDILADLNLAVIGDV